MSELGAFQLSLISLTDHANWHSNKIYMVGQVSKKGLTNEGYLGQGEDFF